MVVQRLLVHRAQLNFNLNLNTEIPNKSYVMLLAGQWLVLCYRICFAQERIDWWSGQSDGIHHAERERRGGLSVDWGNWHTLQVGGSYQGWQLRLGEGFDTSCRWLEETWPLGVRGSRPQVSVVRPPVLLPPKIILPQVQSGKSPARPPTGVSSVRETGEEELRVLYQAKWICSSIFIFLK